MRKELMIMKYCHEENWKVYLDNWIRIMEKYISRQWVNDGKEMIMEKQNINLHLLKFLLWAFQRDVQRVVVKYESLDL